MEIYYVIKASDFPDFHECDEFSQFVIVENGDGLSIWEDWYGDFDGGDDPAYSEINSEGQFKNLTDIKNLLLKYGLTNSSIEIKKNYEKIIIYIQIIKLFTKKKLFI